MSSNEYEERISHGSLAIFLSEREMFTRLKTRRTRNGQKRSPTSRLLRRDLSESPSNPRHLERKKDLRNDRFRMDNGRHLANTRKNHSSPIANRHNRHNHRHARALSREQETRKYQTPDAVTELTNSRNCDDHSSVFQVPPLLKRMWFATTQGK